MITQKEFNCIRNLTDWENQLFYRLKEGERQATAPQLREDLQKLSAQVSNHKHILIKTIGDGL